MGIAKKIGRIITEVCGHFVIVGVELAIVVAVVLFEHLVGYV